MDKSTEQGDLLSNPSVSIQAEASDSVLNKSIEPAKRIEELAKELEKAVREVADTKTIMMLGFFILVIMVATMLISVFTLFIQALKDSNQGQSHQYRNFDR